MSYDAELSFLRDTFEKCHLQTHLLQLDEATEKYSELCKILVSVEPKKIYHITDTFLCCYILLLLPDAKEKTLLLIGPYLSSDLTQNSPLFVMLESFGSIVWNEKDKLTIVNWKLKRSHATIPFVNAVMSEEPEHGMEHGIQKIHAMEQRYEFENEFMQAISLGQMRRAERLLAGFSTHVLEQRVTDCVRNLKNYSIIMNTLLRKAAENGGVHPIYLDRISADFAKRIEQTAVSTDVSKLMQEMVRTYCRLVKKHSDRQYSPPVQKVITYIDSDLSADLSLRAMAAMQNVSAGYLSSLFKQETGQTLTAYVNQKRIQYAMLLLKTTKLQVQAIALKCGMVDVHYFSKLFKKYVGRTPKEYRENSLILLRRHWD